MELLRQLDHDRSEQPWLVVSSFVNPHDISVSCQPSLASGAYDFHVDGDVPADEELFRLEYDASHGEDLMTKPRAQKSYAENCAVWGGPIPDALGPHYRRFYYQLHKNLDEQIAELMKALLTSRFKDDTIVVFLSDHGEMLGAHGDLHQKM